MSFTLHPQLLSDTLPVGELPLSRLVLMNNRRFPWVILVPRVEGVREIFELTPSQQSQLMDETASVAKALNDLVQADKINIAALGNQVPQLHMHVIARFSVDAAWPKPVWNAGLSTDPYPEAEAAKLVSQLGRNLHITKM